MSVPRPTATPAPVVVALATTQDVSPWIDLAREVGNLFGADMAGDPAFEAGVRRNIARKTAFCVRLDGHLAGAMTFREDRITWLAVARAFRRRGVGRALVTHALSTANEVVRVTTFGKNHPHPDAGAATSLYLALGFAPSEEDPGTAPGGSPRKVFLWKR